MMFERMGLALVGYSHLCLQPVGKQNCVKAARTNNKPTRTILLQRTTKGLQTVQFPISMILVSPDQMYFGESGMFLLDLSFALVIGFLLVLLVSALFRDRTPWGSFWIFLLVVFLVTWAGGIWIGPFGPTFFEVAWLPFLIVGIFITVLLASTVPPRTSRPQKGTIEEAKRAEAPESVLAGLTLFFWIALILTLIAIILAYTL